MSLLVTALFSFKSPANFHSVIHRLFSVNIHYPFRTGFYLTVKSKQVQVVNKCTAYSQVYSVHLLIQIHAFKKELIRTDLIFKCVNVFVFFCPHNTRILLSFASADGTFPGCSVDMCLWSKLCPSKPDGSCLEQAWPHDTTDSAPCTSTRGRVTRRQFSDKTCGGHKINLANL